MNKIFIISSIIIGISAILIVAFYAETIRELGNEGLTILLSIICGCSLTIMAHAICEVEE